MYLLKECLSHCRGEKFGVIQVWKAISYRQDDRGSHYWAGERPSACFVNAGNALGTAPGRLILESGGGATFGS